MLEKYISLGDKIEIKKLTALGVEEEGPYRLSNVLEIIDDGHVGIAMPIERGSLIPMDVGDRYRLCFYGKSGLYQSKGIVSERYKKDRLYIAVIKLTAAFEKLQRRQYFRLDCFLKIEYRPYTETVNEKNEVVRNYGGWQGGNAIDISGGGMRFISPDYKPNDKKYEIAFSLAINGVMRRFTENARLVHASSELNKAGMYEYRVEFLDVDPKDRELIIKYVFDEERNRRKKI